MTVIVGQVAGRSASRGRLYGRAFEIVAYRSAVESYFGAPTRVEDTIRIRDAAVQFTVEKNLGGEPNRASVVITNLAPATRARLVQKPLVVSIAAGYDRTSRHIFTGDARDARNVPAGTEYETQIQLGDGDRAYRHARVNRSYRAGTSVITALRDVAASMGLALPNNVKVSSELREQFSSGVALYGPAREELTRLLAPYGYTWSVQNGRLQILRGNETSADTFRLLDESTGLVGTPQWSTPSGPGEPSKVTAQALLYPELTPGGRVKLASREVNGMFKIVKVTHTGDTHGDEWLTTIEARPL